MKGLRQVGPMLTRRWANRRPCPEKIRKANNCSDGMGPSKRSHTQWNYPWRKSRRLTQIWTTTSKLPVANIQPQGQRPKEKLIRMKLPTTKWVTAKQVRGVVSVVSTARTKPNLIVAIRKSTRGYLRKYRTIKDSSKIWLSCQTTIPIKWVISAVLTRQITDVELLVIQRAEARFLPAWWRSIPRASKTRLKLARRNTKMNTRVD